MLSRRAALVFGIANSLTATLVLLGVFVGLPSRWAPVDVAALVLAVLELAGGVGLIVGAPWAGRFARAASAVALAVGLGLITALSLTASWLTGVYGPVGFGGAAGPSLAPPAAFPSL